MLHVFYKYSDSGPTRYCVRPDGFTKRKCLENCISKFPNGIFHIIADNVTRETVDWLTSKHLEVDVLSIIDEAPQESGAQARGRTAVRVIARAIEICDEGDLIYFVEDDYIHADGSEQCLVEGLKFADYVTLYDYPGDYMSTSNTCIQSFHEMYSLIVPLGGGDYIDPGVIGKPTVIFRTTSTHWRKIDGTTLTFALKYETLKEDWETMKRWCRVVGDGDLFKELGAKGRLAVSSVPARSSHAHLPWFAPNIELVNECNKLQINIFPRQVETRN